MTDPHHAIDKPDDQRWHRPWDDFVREANLVKVVDGDTLRLRVDLGWQTTIVEDVRLAWVNTPERRGPELPAGHFVADAVSKFFAEHGAIGLTLQSRVFSVGKYGRCIANVWSEGVCLNQWLLATGLGWGTDDRGRLTSNRDIQDLGGLPEDIRRDVERRMP